MPKATKQMQTCLDYYDETEISFQADMLKWPKQKSQSLY